MSQRLLCRLSCERSAHPRNSQLCPDLHAWFDAVDALPCGFRSAQRQSVTAVREQVRLHTDASLLAGVDQHQCVLIWHDFVGNGVPYEHRRCFGVNMAFDRHGFERFRIVASLAKQRVETAAMRERADAGCGLCRREMRLVQTGLDVATPAVPIIVRTFCASTQQPVVSRSACLVRCR